MKSWFALIPVFALALAISTGCGPSNTTVAPDETPAESDYEAELQEQYGEATMGEEAPEAVKEAGTGAETEGQADEAEAAEETEADQGGEKEKE